MFLNVLGRRVHSVGKLDTSDQGSKPKFLLDLLMAASAEWKCVAKL